jgi:hypothetical protein
MKMFTTIAVATALLGLAACTKNEPAPAPVAAPADNATAPAAPADVSGGGKPAEGGVVQPK